MKIRKSQVLLHAVYASWGLLTSCDLSVCGFMSNVTSHKSLMVTQEVA